MIAVQVRGGKHDAHAGEESGSGWLHDGDAVARDRELQQGDRFYKEAFGAQERFRFPGPGGKIMHAELQIGNAVVMMGDAMPGCPAPTPGTPPPVSFYLYVEDCDTSFDRAVKAGAKVVMPLTDMFWGDRFGQVEDPFGHRWGLASHKL